MPTKLADAMAYGTLEVLIPSWERSLRAGNKAPRTIQSYGDSARSFEVFARETLGVTTAGQVTRATVETYIEDQLQRWKPTTAAVRYRSLQQFFKWLLEEGEAMVNPMERMKPPIIPEVPVPVVSDDDLKKLLKACGGTTFEDRRDTAIVRAFIDTGFRLAEMTGLSMDDIDLNDSMLTVMGKGRKHRSVPFGAKTGQALDRYLRLRLRHVQAKSKSLWLGPKGGMTDSGISQMLKRRCIQAGIDLVHPHQLRHTAAHAWMAEGGSETDAMRLFGWKSRQMLERYGASAADERAQAAHRKLALGDRL